MYHLCEQMYTFTLSLSPSLPLSLFKQVLVDLVLNHCCGHPLISSSSCEKEKASEEDDHCWLTFLDLCCGSGAIAVSLLHDNPSLRGYAIDQSEEAVALTKENAHWYLI